MEPAEHEPWARGYGRLPERNARQLALRLPPDWLLAPQDGLESETRRIVMADIAEQRSPRMREVGNGATEARGIMVSSQRDPAHGFALTLATVAPGSSALATGAASQRGSPRNPDATRYPTAVLSSDLSPRNMGPSQWIGGSLQRTGVEFLGGDIAWTTRYRRAAAPQPPPAAPRDDETHQASWLSPRHHNLFASLRPAAAVAAANARERQGRKPPIITDQMLADAADAAAGAQSTWEGGLRSARARGQDRGRDRGPPPWVSLSPRSVIPPGEDMDKPRVPMSYPGTDGVPHNHYCTFKHGVWAPSFRPEDLRGLNSHLNSITPMV